MNKSKNQVLIVDDEADIREVLELTLGRMNLETRAAANLEEARDLLHEHKFDLCLTDMRLPDGNGIDLVRFIQDKYPYLPVAVITAFGNMETAITALKAGAFDFVSKPLDLNDLRNIVRSALRVTHTPAAAAGAAPTGVKKLLGEYLSGDRQESRYQDVLTSREQEVLKLTAAGYTNHEIAERLVISPKTVDTYRQRIMEKLDLHHRSELVRYALRKGLLVLEE